MGYRPRGHKDSDTTEHMTLYCVGACTCVSVGCASGRGEYSGNSWGIFTLIFCLNLHYLQTLFYFTDLHLSSEK